MYKYIIVLIMFITSCSVTQPTEIFKDKLVKQIGSCIFVNATNDQELVQLIDKNYSNLEKLHIFSIKHTNSTFYTNFNKYYFDYFRYQYDDIEVKIQNKNVDNFTYSILYEIYTNIKFVAYHNPHSGMHSFVYYKKILNPIDQKNKIIEDQRIIDQKNLEYKLKKEQEDQAKTDTKNYWSNYIRYSGQYRYEIVNTLSQNGFYQEASYRKKAPDGYNGIETKYSKKYNNFTLYITLQTGMGHTHWSTVWTE